ncbi:MAG TPA: hypothetical protein VGJ01_06370 [Pseudolabrys sp.]
MADVLRFLLGGRQRKEVVQVDQGDERAVVRNEAGQEISTDLLRDPRHGLDLIGFEGNDVEDTVGQKADLTSADLHDNDDMQGRRLGEALPKAATQVDDRDDDAAQIQHPTHIVLLLRQMADLRPPFDFADGHDVDAVLLLADAKTDELSWTAAATPESAMALSIAILPSVMM